MTYTVYLSKRTVVIKEFPGLTQGKAKRKARKLARAAEENEFVFVKYQEDNKTSGFYNPNGQHQLIARAWNQA